MPELPRLGESADAPFPPTADALPSPNGLLAWGGDLDPARLLKAYRAGIFPWYGEDQPILWWSPAPRCILRPTEVYCSRRTRRRFNSGRFSLSADRCFSAVIAGCAEPRDESGETWITPEMLDAYVALHCTGHAHSVEVWHETELAGGIYGVAMGRIFFGESMFSRQTDASKIALIALCRLLQNWGYVMLDCQVGNSHLYRMGAENWDRDGFETLLRDNVDRPPAPEAWQAPVGFETRW